MKWALRFFALLDLVAFIYSFDFGLLQLSSLMGDQPQTGSQFLTKIIFLLLWLSLLVTAVLLAIPKKLGIFIYYFQLLPRLLFLVLSFGFISYISYFTKWNNPEKILMPVIIFAEMLRVYFSVRIQRDMN